MLLVLALAMGFSVAGLLASGFQLWTDHPAEFQLLHQKPQIIGLLLVPLLVLAGPYIVARRALSLQLDIGDLSIPMLITAVTLSAFWSLLSGTLIVAALQGLGHALA